MVSGLNHINIVIDPEEIAGLPLTLNQSLQDFFDECYKNGKLVYMSLTFGPLATMSGIANIGENCFSFVHAPSDGLLNYMRIGKDDGVWKLNVGQG